MAKKDVELFVIEKRKNAALNKEWEETSKKGNNLKEDEQESFFNKELSPIAKKYGFDFSYNDFCEYKKHNPTPNNNEKLSDDELFNVAGGKYVLGHRDRINYHRFQCRGEENLTDEQKKEYESLKRKLRYFDNY